MEDENINAQQDELLALSSIYDGDVFSVDESEEDSPGGSYMCITDLPQPFVIILTDSHGVKKEFPVQYLPEIVLHFQLPTTYPSVESPQFSVSCKWLKQGQLEKLCEKLDEIWKENKGEVVLFLWINFLQDELLDFFNISSPLDLTDTVPLKRSLSTEDKVEDAKAKDPRAIQDILSQDLLLPLILDFNSKQLERKYNNSMFDCSVCFVEKFGRDCLKFVPCEHVFCKECLKSFFEIQIRDGNVLALTCPQDKCESSATPGQVQETVDEELFARYDRLLLQSSLDTMSDIMYCPRKTCGLAVIMDQEASMGSCDSCGFVFCIFCKQTYHGVSPCKIKGEEMTRLREEYLAATGEEKKKMERRYGRHVLKHLVENSLSEQWLQEKSKKCPHCNTSIEKIDGCNKMTCTKCRTFFCRLCGKSVDRKNPYSHFNTPGQGCFNQLFEGVVVNEWEDEEQEPVFWR